MNPSSIPAGGANATGPASPAPPPSAPSSALPGADSAIGGAPASVPPGPAPESARAVPGAGAPSTTASPTVEEKRPSISADVHIAEVSSGTGLVFGNQYITTHYGGAGDGPGTTSPRHRFIDDRDPVPPSAEPDAEHLARFVDLLSERRLLLIRHAPGESDRAAATDALRAVLREQRRTVTSKRLLFGSQPLMPLSGLRLVPDWPGDWHGATLFLRRDVDVSLNEFFGSLEQVGALIDWLRNTDCQLVLTAAMPAGTVLRDEGALARRIALWTFAPATDAPRAPEGELPVSRLDLTLASIVALFPGLGPEEFGLVAERLVPPPSEVTVPASLASGAGAAVSGSATPAPPSRDTRWRDGLRDEVLRELGIGLRPQADAAAGGVDDVGPSTLGLVFLSPERCLEMPSRLLREHPLLLVELIRPLAEHYFNGTPSRTFRAHFRTLLWRLHDTGVQRIDPDWLWASIGAGLDGAQGQAIAERMAALWNDRLGADATRGGTLLATLIDRLGQTVVDTEAALIEALRALDLLLAPTRDGCWPVSAEYWSVIDDLPGSSAALEPAVRRQLFCLDLLIQLSVYQPALVARALARALNEANGLHARWARDAGQAPLRRPAMSLARQLFSDYLVSVHDRLPALGAHVAHAMAEVFGPATGGDRGAGLDEQTLLAARWLGLDLLGVLIRLLREDGDMGWAHRHAPALARDELPAALGDAIAGLVAMTAPPRGDDEETVTRSARRSRAGDRQAPWMFYRFAEALRGRDAVTAEPALTALLAPWKASLTRDERADIVADLRDDVDAFIDRRDDLDARETRHALTRKIQALQLVLKVLRAPAAAPPAGRD